MNIIPNVDVNDNDNGVISFFFKYIYHIRILCTAKITHPCMVYRDDNVIQQRFIPSELFYFGSTRRSSSGKRIMGSGKEISRAARSSHREGGSSFVETWRKFGRGAVARTNGRGWRRGEGVLYPYP